MIIITKKKSRKKAKTSLDKNIQDLMSYLYEEAKQRIVAKVDVKLSASGFETPLGTLTLEQIEKGEKILLELWDIFKDQKCKNKKAKLEQLSSKFYSTIPHKLGRSQAAVQQSIINTHEHFDEKQETIQLMKDMLKVNDKAKQDSGESIFESNDAHAQLEALGLSAMECLKPSSSDYKSLIEEIRASVQRSHNHSVPKVKRIFKIKRPAEEDRYEKIKHIGNERTLYHGSRCCNWVGILSRGLLMPKIVVTLGVKRTDGGWLGDGIYFGECDTAAGYAQPGSNKDDAFFLCAKVALGKAKGYNKITHGLQIPQGYHSAHGQPGPSSEFYDNEYCIYDENQHYSCYLVEFAKYN